MPSLYTALEYANMHLVYGECRCNATAAARLYRERYPNAERHPDHRVFISLHQLYSEGRLPSVPRHSGRPRANYEDIVLNEVEQDSGTSVRAIELRTGIPKSSAHRILKTNKYHPYHVQRVQSLLPRDYPQRIYFCRTILEKKQ